MYYCRLHINLCDGGRNALWLEHCSSVDDANKQVEYLQTSGSNKHFTNVNVLLA